MKPDGVSLVVCSNVSAGEELLVDYGADFDRSDYQGSEVRMRTEHKHTPALNFTPTHGRTRRQPHTHRHTQS